MLLMVQFYEKKSKVLFAVDVMAQWWGVMANKYLLAYLVNTTVIKGIPLD
jgi:hypothetical protein